MLQFSHTLRLIVLTLLASFTTSVHASVININPGSYEGQWLIDNATGYVSGSRAVDLPPGRHYVRISAGGFHFDVDSSGNVTVPNGISATGAPGALTFNTYPVVVDPVGFTGDTYITRVSSGITAPSTLFLVPGIRYTVRPGHVGAFNMFVDGSGNVTVENGVSATGGAGVVTFNTVVVNVDPADFSGETYINRVTSSFDTPIQVNLVPGIRYSIKPGHVGSFYIAVAADGSVLVENNASAAWASGTLTFNTIQLLIDPEDFSGNTYVNRVTGSFNAPILVNLVPGVPYSVKPGHAGSFRITLDTAGEIVVENGISATWTSGTLLFNTTAITVTPDTAQPFYINQVSAGTIGMLPVKLVPGVNYSLKSGATKASFTVAEPCAINPPTIELSGTTFMLDCGAADSDGDGVPDNTDNCPAVPNPEQIDQDLDGLGNLCDIDLDGDDVANTFDNCPALANASQSDLDGDGVGDACDSDADSDSVPDNIDNCPALANTDQADSDGDLLGDACDSDNDNDGIDDIADNCPLTTNADQADFDGNGQGDVCDGDIDGDLVANDDDDCPLSPADQAVNAAGCTGAQHIALRCSADNYVQHGRYVSCVAHAANEGVRDGLMAPNEKARFVKEAAKSR